MNVVSYTDARNNLKEVLDQVTEHDDVVIITRKGNEHAVIMSLEHYNSLTETAHLLSSPANVLHLAQSIQELRGGKLHDPKE